MIVKDAAFENKYDWDAFVAENYPPIGSFISTWEWGEFQEDLGRGIGRYIVIENNVRVAAFTVVHFDLPLGLSYGYIPRGPVIASSVTKPDEIISIFKTIQAWAGEKFPHFVFLRIEPPLPVWPKGLEGQVGFCIPSYYVQPRYNTSISLSGSEDDIAASFHPSTRSNLHRSEKRGVRVETKTEITADDYAAFGLMMKDTIKRNSGKNAYPSDAYFRSLLRTIPFVGEKNGKRTLSLRAYYGYHEGEPASAHFVLFFGKTATYLYGASRTDHLNSKVDTYLHWVALREARREGFDYYDLGGIDHAKWPTLTDFKRQFRGKETVYVGNCDIVFRPALYRSYSLLRNIRHL